MLYRRTSELKPIKQETPPSDPTIITSELSIPEAIWLETCQTKVKDENEFKIGSYPVALTVSRKVNVNKLFEHIDEMTIDSGYFQQLSAIELTANSMHVNRANISVIETTSLTSQRANISLITATEISNSNISSNVGIINNLVGEDIRYTNGDISNITATNISTTDLTAVEKAELKAAATYWADLAEYYDFDNDYSIGTLVEFGSNNELTLAKTKANAVITEKPAIAMNSQLKNSNKFAKAIVLVGRSRVLTVGKVEKFDRLYLSNIPGLASNIENGNAIGIALESSDDDNEKLIKAIIKLNI